VERIELPSPLALLLAADLCGTRQRPGEDRLKVSMAGDLATDVADDAADWNPSSHAASVASSPPMRPQNLTRGRRGILKMKLQGSGVFQPKTLQSQNYQPAKNRLSLNRLDFVHGQLYRVCRRGVSKPLPQEGGFSCPRSARRREPAGAAD
jgi:hypothetical protein